MRKIVLVISTFTVAVSVFMALTGSAQQVSSVPFAQREVKLENGITGKPLTFESGTPRNFEEVIGKTGVRSVKLDGQLFVPEGTQARAVIIIAPGSGGVNPSHLLHAQKLTSAGMAVYVLDPFAGRGIKETISDQTQLTFAASAYDILAAARMLAMERGIDGQRIGALGYSRGGAALLLAAHQQMTRPVLGEGKYLKAVLAGWPWCGFQFEHAITAPTAVRLLVGDSDNWVSPVQCQGQVAAMRANNSQVSIRFFKEAYHGFGYSFPPRETPNAMKMKDNAPILYVNDQGTFLDVYTGQPITSDDTHILAPWLVRATVTTGSRPGQSEAFVDDMVGFFKAQLTP